jgi:hypothetical protein
MSTAHHRILFHMGVADSKTARHPTSFDRDWAKCWDRVEQLPALDDYASSPAFLPDAVPAG